MLYVDHDNEKYRNVIKYFSMPSIGNYTLNYFSVMCIHEVGNYNMVQYVSMFSYLGYPCLGISYFIMKVICEGDSKIA